MLSLTSEVVERAGSSLRAERDGRVPSDLYDLYHQLSWEGLKADVYLAFLGSGPLHLSGFLVTERNNIDRIIALCPVAVESGDPKSSYRNLQEQLQRARKIAQDPRCAEEMEETIVLRRLLRNGVPIPRWFYALSCIPLGKSTNGEFLHPTPYCPALLAQLQAGAHD